MVSDLFIICIKSGKLQQPYVLCKQRDDPTFPKVHLSIQDFVVVNIIFLTRSKEQLPTGKSIFLECLVFKFFF